ncbi:P-loop NTPase fold protein [Epibacterium ulvae]|uniref:P-loop NTPase fold protein n=1 Tax=Epibacterium ulvae TaxID=1156985 RepID=UPI00248F8006|nr:P-loop NTPase fold protein [Epibacterium ulvae]
MVNETARHVVERYLNMEAPKYALLVDAPWGCGKTHFIKEVTKCEMDQSRLYLSLYGVHTAEQFDWALVRAMKPWTDGVAAKWTGRAKELASGVKVFGIGVDLTKVDLTEIGLMGLPDTLIFDDVERCGLDMNPLMGLINRFVEHDGKRVILVANSDEHKELPDFLKTREKLVGQVVSIQADVDAAIANALTKMPEGQGRTFLTDHQSVIKEIFEEARHQNLRLLMRAMRDAADLIDKIEPEMVAFTESMLGLLRTFLALHMAYHGGKITKEDVGRRTEIRIKRNRRLLDPEFQHPDFDPEKQSFDDVLWDTEVLGDELASQLFVEGYATCDQINIALKNTHRFAEPAQQPDWLRQWGWHEESDDEFDAICARIDARLAAHEIIEPGEILHVYHARAHLGKYLDDFDEQENAWFFCKYICDLIDEGKLPARSLGVAGFDNGYGFSLAAGTVVYKGHSSGLDKYSAFLANFMCKEMDEVLKRELTYKAEELMGLMSSAPGEFCRQLRQREQGGSYWNVSILHNLDVEKFVSVWMALMENDRHHAIVILQLCGDRVSTGQSSMEDEALWSKRLFEKLVEEAKKISPMRVAQVRRILQSN